MQMPTFNFKTTTDVMVSSFAGLNQSSTISDNELSDGRNISSDKMPFLSVRKPRTNIVTGITGIKAAIAPQLVAGDTITNFTGIAGTTFYYKGEVVSGATISSDNQKCLIDYNGYILIFPDKLYYCYTGAEDAELKNIEDGFVSDDSTTYSFVFDTSGSVKDNNLTNTIKYANGWDGKFKSGDSLTINTSVDGNNTVVINSKYIQTDNNAIVSCVVASVSDDDKTLTVNCYNRLGEKLAFKEGTGTGTVKRAMPDITKACVCNNRIFGVDEVGELIYASKLADFKNWNVFEGLSTDSWYAEVGTEGRFTAIVPYRQSVIAFKDNYIHQLYGSAPSNFSLSKQIAKGCIDGRSVAEVNNVLYFLSYDGIYSYTGGNPECVSYKLAQTFSDGVGGSDGRKYYFASSSPSIDFLVYDTLYNVWQREDSPGNKVVGFVRYNDGIYAACDTPFESGTGMVRLNTNGNEVIDWSANSKWFTDSVMEMRSPINIYIRARLKRGAYLEVYVNHSENDSPILCGKVEGPPESGYVYNEWYVRRIPVLIKPCDMYQILLKGKGDVVVEAIERKITTCGRHENFF